jgi:O-antigen ligase
MKAVIVLGALFLAAFSGLAAGLFGWIGALAVLVLAAPALFIVDYRVGVCALIIAMPFSRIHPRAFYVVAALMLLSAGVFFVHRFFSRTRLSATPRWFWVGLMLPILLGFALAWPHLAQARATLALWGLDEAYTVKVFLIQSLGAPLAMIGLAWMLGQAIRESRSPGVFIAAIALACVISAAAIGAVVVGQGVSLSRLMVRREFLGVLGGHSNEWGPMLAVATGPFLYLAADSQGWRRAAYVTVLLVLLCGIALTFSRGGYLAFMIVLLVFIAQRGRPAMILAVVLSGLILVAIAPPAIVERALTGLDADSVRQMASGSRNDALSAGRFALYAMFAPEILKSPVWGSGTGSAGWSTAVQGGWTLMLHPHNLYLRILMDIGVLGLLALGWFYWHAARAMRQLARLQSLPPDIRSYLSGSFAGLVAMLVSGVSGGHWLPTAAHAFFWYSVGIILAYWPNLGQIKAEQPTVVLGDARARALAAQRARAWPGHSSR